MSTLYKFNPTSTTQITRELHTSVGSGIYELGYYSELGDGKRGFKGLTDFEIWDSAAAGTQLTEGVDYDLKNIDTVKSSPSAAGYDVYTGVQVTNATYQTGAIYITYKIVGSYIEADTINDIIKQVGYNLVGKEIKTLNKYQAISPEFPYFCLSLPSQDWAPANYPTAFIAEMRSRKLTYDEMVTDQTAFTGSWASVVFTLDNNASNIALITALSEDYLTEGSFTGFRILSDGSNEFEIVSLDALARTITVNAGAPTGTEIEIYLYRVFGSTTSARHHSEAGLSAYQAGGDKINSMRRLDQMQQITGSFGVPNGMRVNNTHFGAFTASGATTTAAAASVAAGAITSDFDSANSSGARTGSTTRIESTTRFDYLFTGGYTV